MHIKVTNKGLSLILFQNSSNFFLNRNKSSKWAQSAFGNQLNT